MTFEELEVGTVFKSFNHTFIKIAKDCPLSSKGIEDFPPNAFCLDNNHRMVLGKKARIDSTFNMALWEVEHI